MRHNLKLAVLAGVLAAGTAAMGSGIDTFFVIPPNGIPSHDGFNAPGNAIIFFDVAAAAGLPSGTPVVVNGFDYDVTLFADPNVGTFGGSWLQELRVGCTPVGGTTGIFFSPGAGNTTSGTAHFSSGGVTKFSTIGIQDFVLPNGVLQMQFYESFDDAAGVDDGRWLSGNLTFQIAPAPSSLALMGAGGIVAFRRRRR